MLKQLIYNFKKKSSVFCAYFVCFFIICTQMSGKSCVSALGEYCAKKAIDPPVYDWIESTDSGFICKVTVMEYVEHGTGRSKRDAKHFAAANVIKKIKVDHPDIEEIPVVPIEEIPTKDMVMYLRDYCVQNCHPLPTIEIVAQAGTPDAPEFTALCTLASIKRYGVSEKKKDARQKAAYEMLNVILNDQKLDHQMQVVPLQEAAEDIECERYQKFKTYRELTETNSNILPGVKLCDRHNYFKNFYPQLKNEALAIIKSKSYDSYESQVYDMLKALKITPKVQVMPNVTTASDPLLFITLNCDYDACFAGTKSEVYPNMLQYFEDMLF